MGTTYGNIKFIGAIVIGSLLFIGCYGHERLGWIDRKSEFIASQKDKKQEETYINEKAVVTSYCILRELPDENSEKIATCNKGDKINIISKLSNNWYKVETDEKIGYIQEKFIESTEKLFIDSSGEKITSVKQDGTIIADSNIQDEIINYAYNYWYKLPDNVRNRFRNDGWSIVLTNNSLKDEANTLYEISGLTIPDEKTIKIKAEQSSIRRALIHEIGHYIDYSLGYISETEDFIKLFNSESDNITWQSEAKFTHKEFFAEAFRFYYSNEAKYSILLNDTYKYMEEIIFNF